MKIISATQSKSLDQETMKSEPITSIDLMERAGHLLYEKIYEKFGLDKTYIILCGNGNNGGDGLVIARKLYESDCKVLVFIDKDTTHKSPENLQNLKRLKNLNIKTFDFSELKEVSENHSNLVTIDALFGIGLNRPLEQPWAERISEINEIVGEKVAIDLPSGLMADDMMADSNKIFRSDITYTIGQPKLSFFLPETGNFIGNIEVIDIQQNQYYLEKLDSNYFYVDQFLVQKIYKPRKRFSHKGTYGHALIIAGSYGKIGASVLTTKVTLKAGAGLVTSYIPRCGYEIMQSSVPEAMCLTDKDENYISSFPNIENYKSIGIGPGLGTDAITKNAFYQWLKNSDFHNKSLVLDADALNLMSQDKSLLQYLSQNAILTPHPKEFERLVGSSKNSLDRLKLAQDFAHQNQMIIVLKDAVTVIISPDAKVYFNSTGNAALATGGSGDTLTGIITGLLSQGYSSIQACQLGVWLHGKSADLALTNESMESFIASQITDYLSTAFKSISK
ncbi:NAD(P)H-hydrate dehydratase [Flavobacteriaceae bacterium Ap0902]|nr:NAD(P)H-hydrate dehydratase [Flavobacteriaceae bacterium Ap0902]